MDRMKIKSEGVIDAEVLAWAEAGVQTYTALFYEGLYTHTRFSRKVCMNKAIEMVADVLDGLYGLGEEQSLCSARRMVDALLPKVEAMVRNAEAELLAGMAAGRIADATAKAIEARNGQEGAA